MAKIRVQQWVSASAMDDPPVLEAMMRGVRERFIAHAEHAGLTLNVDSIIEVQRKALAERDVGEEDDEGNPTTTLVEIGSYWCPDENVEPDTFMIVWEGEAS